MAAFFFIENGHFDDLMENREIVADTSRDFEICKINASCRSKEYYYESSIRHRK